MPTLGVIGKPNVGKSTFFSAATLATVEIANYPFTTKKANLGITYVRTECVCKEFNVTDTPANSLCVNGTRLVPVKLIDCPGLVSGAWQGRGLGNQFLDEVRKADALLLVVDASGSTDLEGRPGSPGSYDPSEDVRFLQQEFDMWLLQIIKKDWDRLAKKSEVSKETVPVLLEEKLSGLQITRQSVATAVSELDLASKQASRWTDEDLTNFTSYLRKVSKPIVIVANKIDVSNADRYLERLKETGYDVIPCSAEGELALRLAAEKGLINYTPGDNSFRTVKEDELTDKQKNGLVRLRERVFSKYQSTGVQQANDFAYLKILKMIGVFPVEDHEKLTDHKGRVL
ncbi:MAG: YchF-related putative GTPase, partial [Candidatus Bathyarchaeia archaeon]